MGASEKLGAFSAIMSFCLYLRALPARHFANSYSSAVLSRYNFKSPLRHCSVDFKNFRSASNESEPIRASITNAKLHFFTSKLPRIRAAVSRKTIAFPYHYYHGHFQTCHDCNFLFHHNSSCHHCHQQGHYHFLQQE